MDNYEIALERASEVFGDKVKAEEWLEKMSVSLGKAPKFFLTDRTGLDQVLRHLRSVELALNTD